jgi:hypothetical protein
MLRRVIESVQIVADGPANMFKVGFTYSDQKVTDIIEVNGNFLIYGEGDVLLFEVRNCPVVVGYTDAKDRQENTVIGD